MDADPLGAFFREKREELGNVLVSQLTKGAFDNPYTLHPRRLAELGAEIVEKFLGAVDAPDDAAASAFGRKIALQGVAEKTAVFIVATLHRFFAERLDAGCASAAECVAAVDSFTCPFLEGFMKARESQILSDQEQLRRALSAALQTQGHELLVKDQAISTSINGIMLTSLEGRVTYVNPSFLTLWGFESPAEVIGRGFEEFWIGEEALKIPKTLPRAGGWRGELLARRRDQSSFNVELAASLICDEKGEAVGIMTSFIDVTDRKKLQTQIIQAQKMEALGQLAGGIAHDFNNLLAAINGYLQLLLVDAPRESSLYRDLIEITAAVDKGTALTRQLRFFTRQAAGTLQIASLNDIVRETLQLIRHTFPPEIVIELSLSSSAVNIEADPNQVSQVLVNLCVNARDAMTDQADATSRGTLTVVTSAVELSEADAARYVNGRPGKFILLQVRDTGVGMPPELLDKLFIPFVTTKGARSGTGLGLAVVYGIVAAHHGFVGVKSTEGKGSTFEVFLPMTERQIEPRAGDLAEPSRSRGHGTILVVDDNTQVREVMMRMLQGSGYTCIGAKEGKDALERFENGAGIDLVLLDIVMQGMGGRECLQLLRQADPRARVLVVTGHITDGSVQELLDDGAIGVVEKPFHQRELIMAVQDALARRL